MNPEKINSIFSNKFGESPERAETAIKELRKPIQQILQQLSTRINRGEYTLIIGDDASGRIPTLIFKEVINDVYNEKRRENPKTLFFAGSGRRGIMSQEKRKEKEEKLEDWLQNRHFSQKSDGQKALIVTDLITSGNSLEPLCSALKKNNMDFDIATITNHAGNSKDKKEISEKLGGEIFDGQSNTPLIYGKPSLSGVTKNPPELFSHPYEFKNEEEKSDFLETRKKYIPAISKEITEWYKNKYLK